MPAPFDPSEFEDADLQAGRHTARSGTALASAVPAGEPQRPPSREEVDARVTEMQQRLADLKRAQETLERERASLEETRRRQIEFDTGRQEVLQQLTRGIGLLEEAEFGARRDAEQMARTLGDFRTALDKVREIHEELWTKEDFPLELTRALTTIDNARMEWNAARLKFAILNDTGGEAAAPEATSGSFLAGRSLGELCKIGLALTWPLAVVALITLGVLLVIVLRK